MAFRDDYNRGADWEQELLLAITYFTPARLTSVEEQLAGANDIHIPSTDLWVEAKHDYMAAHTGNLYLETLVQNRPTSELKLGWVFKLHSDCVVCWKVKAGEYYSATSEEIAGLVKHGNFKNAKFTKAWPQSEGVLAPTHLFDKWDNVEEMIKYYIV